MILPHLILPRTKSENGGSNAIIQRRLDSLTQCKFMELYNEARAIQVRLPKQKMPKEESDLKSFNKFMCQGTISSPMKCLSDHQKGGILSLKEKIGEKTILELLKEKHNSPGTLGKILLLTNLTPSHITTHFLTRSTLRRSAKQP